MKYDIIDNFKRTEKIQSELRFGDFDKVKDPFFSVVIPTYRRPDLLKETIMSAVNQENFDFPYEIIVVARNSDLQRTLIPENHRGTQSQNSRC